jgi:hypothetical protein
MARPSRWRWRCGGVAAALEGISRAAVITPVGLYRLASKRGVGERGPLAYATAEAAGRQPHLLNEAFAGGIAAELNDRG